jgi:hypothetical protein
LVKKQQMPFGPQSVEYFEGHGPIHRHPDSVAGLRGVWDSKITTLAEAWRFVFFFFCFVFGLFCNAQDRNPDSLISDSAAVAKHGDRPCLGSRTMTGGTAGAFVFKTYKEINQRVQNIAAGYRSLGLPNVCGGYQFFRVSMF